MISFNKIQDVYHTSLRLYSILSRSTTQKMTDKGLYLIDFINCFPQHIKLVSKKQFKFLKNIETPISYRGNIQSHFYLLNKTQIASTRLLQAKGIFGIEAGVVSLQLPIEHISTIKYSESISQLISLIETTGHAEINKSLRIYEDRYETSN